MPEYLVLLAPSSNRVYAGDAPAITAAEAEIVVSAVHLGGVVGASPTTVAGVPYLAVELADAVDPRILGGLAATFAVFEREGDLLRPVEARGGERFDDDLLTIPKYPGKTNEQLTRVLLNVTLASTDLPDRARRTVLDPLAGRGTTLSWALTLGHDAVGVEVERREVEAYSAFLTTWLRRKRLKHRIGLTPLRRDGRRLGDLLEAEIGRDDPQSLVLFAADTLATAELLQRRRVDVVVTDAPYGVAHGSRGVEAGGTAARRTCSRTPCPCGSRCCAPAVRSGSPGTPTVSRADLVARVAAPASRSVPTGRTGVSPIAWTRASTATCSSPGSPRRSARREDDDRPRLGAGLVEAWRRVTVGSEGCDHGFALAGGAVLVSRRRHQASSVTVSSRANCAPAAAPIATRGTSPQQLQGFSRGTASSIT